jgi:hypothetical protein
MEALSMAIAQKGAFLIWKALPHPHPARYGFPLKTKQ